MFKYVEYALADNNDQYVHLIHPSHGLTKVAASGFGADLEEAVANLKREEGKTYVLVNALSAGEYYGPNKNADYFPEQALLDHHKSFEEFGYVYKHHKNNDPKRSYGRAVFSHYNPLMKRVELIISLDNEKAHDIIERIDKGQNAYVSMGCKVPFDYCSICNNAAKTRAQYCDHMRTMPGKTLPDGRKVYVINKKPRFFDISFVTVPADRTAGFMAKVASHNAPVLSADIAEEALKSASEVKEAVINKKIISKVEAVSDDPLALIRDSQPDIPAKTLKKLAESYPVNEILSTFQGARIMPTEKDFQRLMLYSSGNEKLANELDAKGEVFSMYPHDGKATTLGNVGLDFFNEKIASEILPLVPERSLTKPLVTARVLTKLAFDIHFTGEGPESNTSLRDRIFGPRKSDFKESPHKNPIVALAALNGVYIGFKNLLNKTVTDPTDLQKLDVLLRRNPALMMTIAGGVSGASLLAQHGWSKQASVGPTFIPRTLVAVPLTYTYSGRQESRRRQGEELGTVQNWVRKHPFLSSIIATVASKPFVEEAIKFRNLRKMASSISPEDLDKIYNGITGIDAT